MLTIDSQSQQRQQEEQENYYSHYSMTAVIDDAELLNILGLSTPIYELLDWDDETDLSNNSKKLIPDLIGAEDEEEYDDLESIYSSSTHHSQYCLPYPQSQQQQQQQLQQQQHKKRKCHPQHNEDLFADYEFIDVVFPTHSNINTTATTTTTTTTVNSTTTEMNDVMHTSFMDFTKFQPRTCFIPESCENDSLLNLNHAEFAKQQEEDIRLSMDLASL
ncbi:hypothetical protein BDF20DRAFT_987386 [Mycotypha africana]|uniref:uncharacterized protein n=1 Tax=Mycotypha africana TaxID=64632 RepID=UPI002301BE70|nr:uncharacterized protein BDF20DRAFT_987386 [Mycotypha africana]KAI8979059.1 hypothetical protein BDF20DRAFT_987386 [Mycotypha africana]